MRRPGQPVGTHAVRLKVDGGLAYVELHLGRRVDLVESSQAVGNLVLDFNIDGRLVGIEFLDLGALPPGWYRPARGTRDSGEHGTARASTTETLPRRRGSGRGGPDPIRPGQPGRQGGNPPEAPVETGSTGAGGFGRRPATGRAQPRAAR